YNSDKNVKWESLNNREISLDGISELKLVHAWNKYPKIDISELKEIPSEKLMEDFDLIKTMVLQVHPGVYRYSTESEINQALDKLKRSFQRDLSYGEAYLVISELLGQIQCDHTFASFYNQGPILKEVIHNQKDKIPFTFKWIRDRMVVLKNASEAVLPSGSEVVKIDGVLTSNILNDLKKYAKADGATDKSRVSQLEVDGYPYRYNAFDVYYSLKYSVQDTFELEIRTPDGNQRIVNVEPITREKRAEELTKRYPDFPSTKDMLCGYQKLKNKVGLLKAGTFDDSGMDRDWNKYLKETFIQIERDGIKSLIVDLRKNQGGFDEIGETLMRHLMKKPGSLENYVDKTRFKIFPESLKPYAQSWGDPWYYDLEVTSGPDEQGYFERPRYIEPVVKPARNAFDGEVYFLVGPDNVSMAYYLATAIKKNTIGTIIGEETGGNQQGINGGQILFLRLPNSKIEIDVPIVGSFALNNKAPNSGVLPDYQVLLTAKEITENKDPALEKALSLIQNQH
ncbi:MAG: S41 family peptidase, partial [Flavobacteriaceae bacterium]|nr:S41 family peptidase [Flavobacteriaceae bacterium]